MRRPALFLATLAGLSVGATILMTGGVAHAQATTVDLWRISEVVTALGGDPQAQYIELTHPANGCFFQSSRLEAFFADGSPIGTQTPWSASICSSSRTYLIATPQAVTRLGFPADRILQLDLPPAAGQVCFRSSTVRYDCVRWGQIAMPVHDLSGPNDASSAAPPPPDFSLTRVSDTDVVANDFISYIPSPNVVNPVVRNGDAGISGGPDASVPDASFADVFIPDATLDSHIADSAPEDAFDARPNRDATPEDAREHDVAPPGTDFDAGGGGCGCRTGGVSAETSTGPLVLLVLLVLGISLVVARRRRRPSR